MFDSQVTYATMKELQARLIKGKVQKIIQPTSSEVILSFFSSEVYNHKTKNQLLISIHPSRARFHLTSYKYRKDIYPPNFCMLLRKHLEGSILTEINQPPWERILKLLFYKGAHQFQLIIEIMGRHSNLILLNDEATILGAIKHVTPYMSRYRVVIPGKSYVHPPTPNKYFPDKVNREAFLEAVTSFRNKGLDWENSLISSLHGISPLMAEELVYRAKEDYDEAEKFEERLWSKVQELVMNFYQEKFFPAIYCLENGNKLYSVYQLRQYSHCIQENYSSINDMLDNYYHYRQKEETEQELRNNLKHIIQKELKKINSKRKKQSQDLKEAQNAENYRLYGELILSQIEQIPRGSKNISLINFYDPNQNNVDIPLDPRLPAAANAEMYFKKYRRAQNSKTQITKQLEKNQEEINYLENVYYSLENAEVNELEDIYKELVQTGYIKKSSTESKSKKQKRPASKPLFYTSSQGYGILVGKNNTQNEQVTFKLASREDTWLHAQNIPGSHVVIREAPFPPPDETLREAASLAGYYSKNGKLSKVTIDYTQVKHVKRAPGGKPGMVYYKNYKSISVSPLSNLPQAPL